MTRTMERPWSFRRRHGPRGSEHPQGPGSDAGIGFLKKVTMRKRSTKSDAFVEYSVIKEQAPMLQDEYQRIAREQREASDKDAAQKTPSRPKRPVQAKGSDGKKRKLGKKERAKLKAVASKATSTSNDA